jgi:hypothetical protein
MSNITLIDSNLIATDTESSRDTLRESIGVAKRVVNGQLVNLAEMNVKLDNYDVMTETPTEVPNSEFYAQKQTIRLIGDISQVNSQNDWRSLMREIIPAGKIGDHVFDFNMPDEEGPQVPGQSNVETKMYHNVSFFNYEDLTKRLPTTALPSYSTIQQYMMSDQADLENYINYEGTINTNGTLTDVWFQNYYDSYVVSSSAIGENALNISNKNANVFALGSYWYQFGEYVPYCLSVGAEIRQTTDMFYISDKIKDTRKTKNLFQHLKQQEPIKRKFTNNTAGIHEYKIHDVLGWIKQSGQDIFSEAFDELFLLREDERGTESPMDNTLRSMMLYAWCLGESKTKIRDVQSMFNYNSCYRETIGFKIEKYLDTDRGAPIQTIYQSSNKLRMIDTQMKYDQKYVYKISAFVAVLGTSYKYTDLKITSAEGFVFADTGSPALPADMSTLDHLFAAELSVVCEPSLKIIEVPIHSKAEQFVSLPPGAPHWRFSNETGKPNELDIFLSHTMIKYEGDEEVEFIPISTKDKLLLDKYYLSQNKTEGTIATSYKYNSGRFAIYRVDETPTSMEQFGENFLTTIESDMSHLNISTGDYKPNDYDKLYSGYTKTPYCQSAQFTDFILSNKKYYYLFRALSTHGEEGPCTKMFEVENVEASDGSYVSVKEFQFPEKKNFSYKKQMRRFMQIRANPLQTNVNQETLDSQGESSAYNYNQPIELGTLNKSLWGRKFKIRVTSKHTGKKTDINVVFTKKME